MTPRSDVIARRFCDGETIRDLAWSYAEPGDDWQSATDRVEAALRRRLEALLERKRR